MHGRGNPTGPRRIGGGMVKPRCRSVYSGSCSTASLSACIYLGSSNFGKVFFEHRSVPTSDHPGNAVPHPAPKPEGLKP